MKKYLFFALLSMILASCSDDDDKIIDIVDMDKLTGEWVYDNPDEKLWEIMSFTGSGVFYYSNDWDTWQIANDRVDGRYTVNGNSANLQYKLEGMAMNVDMEFKRLGDYDFVALFKDTGKTFTYSRLLKKINLKAAGETVTPDYSSMVSDEITAFASHDREVAEVDRTTGEITAKGAGRTYINLITSKGTAVVEVMVYNSDDPFGDYTWAMGKTLREIQAHLGYGKQSDAKEEHTGVQYTSKNLAVRTETYFTGTTDDDHIWTVNLVLSNYLTDSAIQSILESKYTKFTTTKDGSIGYIASDNKTFVMYNPTDRTITIFQDVEWPVLNNYFGKTAQEVRERMENNGHTFVESYDIFSNDGSDGYLLSSGNTKISAVEFIYNEDNVVSSYMEYFADGVTDREILLYLDELGLVEAENETPIGRGMTFYNQSRTLKVEYILLYNALLFTDNLRTPFIRLFTGAYWKTLGMTRSELEAKYGKPNKEQDGVLQYDLYSYSVYLYYMNITLDSSGKVNLVNVFLMSSMATPTLVKEQLGRQYTLYEEVNGDNGPMYRYHNGKTKSDATLLTTYYSDYGVIVYKKP